MSSPEDGLQRHFLGLDGPAGPNQTKLQGLKWNLSLT